METETARVVVTAGLIPSLIESVMTCSPALNRSSKVNQSSPSGVKGPSTSLVQIICRNSEPAAGSISEQCQSSPAGNVKQDESQSPLPLALNGIRIEESRLSKTSRS